MEKRHDKRRQVTTNKRSKVGYKECSSAPTLQSLTTENQCHDHLVVTSCGKETWLGAQQSQATLAHEASDAKLQNLDIGLQPVPGDTDALKVVDTTDQESRDNFQNIAWPPQNESVHMAVGDEPVPDLDSDIAVEVDASSRLSANDGSAHCFENQVWAENNEVNDLSTASELSLFNQSSGICGGGVSEDHQVLIEESYGDGTPPGIGSCETSSVLYASETVQIPVQLPTLSLDSSDASIHQQEHILQSSPGRLLTGSTANATVEQQQPQQPLQNVSFPSNGVGNLNIAWKGQLQNVAESPGLLLLTTNKETGACEASVIFSPYFKVKTETEVKPPSTQLPEVISTVPDNVNGMEAAGNVDTNHKLTVKEEERLEHDRAATKQTENISESSATARGFMCDVAGCGRSFTSAGYLKHHQMGHNSSRTLCCPVEGCNRKFVWPSHLKYHQLTHMGARLFTCPVVGCGQSFYTAQRLAVHNLRHTGEKPFPCPEEDCPQSFTTAGNLKNHLRVHTGDRPYQCEVLGCSKTFTEYSSLKKHKLVHNGLKPYSCPQCGRQFTQSGSRNVHIRKYHAAPAAIPLEEPTGQNGAQSLQASDGRSTYALSAQVFQQQKNSKEATVGATPAQVVIVTEAVEEHQVATETGNETSVIALSTDFPSDS